MSQPAFTDADAVEYYQALAEGLAERGERLAQTLVEYGIPFCRVCGCTSVAACDPPCFWIAPDLCSSCRGAG